VLLLSTPWPTTRQALETAGDLKGRILIDATNPLRPDLSGLDVPPDRSGGELVALWARGAKVVKAFNTVGSSVMADPIFAGRNALLFYCGDDSEAKKQVHQLAAGLGFDPHDAGPLSQSRLLEPFALLWISLALKHGYGREFAFSLLKRE
jgi:predicted dinucleotide-binding enzyme